MTMTSNTDDKQDPITQLLTQSPVVINVGLEGFATDLQSQDVPLHTWIGDHPQVAMPSWPIFCQC